MIDLTEIIVAVIALISAIFVRYVVPYIKSQIHADKLNDAMRWARISVEAAEMIYRESGMGSMKKKYVLDFLNSKGFTYSEAEIDNLIESAVLELKNSL